MNKLLIASISLPLLIACGGGGGSSPDTASTDSTAETTTSVATDEQLVVQEPDEAESVELGSGDQLSGVTAGQSQAVNSLSHPDDSVTHIPTLAVSPGIDSTVPATDVVAPPMIAEGVELEEVSVVENPGENFQENVVISLQHKNQPHVIAIADIVESTADRSAVIEVPEGFILSSEQQYSLSIDHGYTKAYLSVCSDYHLNDDGSYSINYESCVLRTSLNKQNYETIITITNDVTSVVTALWFLDSSIEPVFIAWELDEKGVYKL